MMKTAFAQLRKSLPDKKTGTIALAPEQVIYHGM